MRLLFFADLHLDSQFAWLQASPDTARRWRQDLREALLKILGLASELQVDAVLCAGDLYEHDRVTPDTAEFLRAAFAELEPIPIYISPGNHDWYGPQSVYRRVDWSSNVHVFQTNRLEATPLDDRVTLWGGAHCAPAGTAGFLENFAVDRDSLHLALFHGSERGWFSEQGSGKDLHAPFSVDQIEQAGLLHAFVGHFHRPRDGDRHTYPGNPNPLAFGEDGVRGAVLVTIKPDGSLYRERHRVALTNVHDFAIDLSGCASQQDVRERIRECTSGYSGIGRITLAGELGQEVDLRPEDFASAAPSLDAVVVRLGQIETGYDFEAISQEPTVRGQFVRDVIGADLSADERRRVLITGLRALEGRADLEVI